MLELLLIPPFKSILENLDDINRRHQNPREGHLASYTHDRMWLSVRQSTLNSTGPDEAVALLLLLFSSVDLTNELLHPSFSPHPSCELPLLCKDGVLSWRSTELKELMVTRRAPGRWSFISHDHKSLSRQVWTRTQFCYSSQSSAFIFN